MLETLWSRQQLIQFPFHNTAHPKRMSDEVILCLIVGLCAFFFLLARGNARNQLCPKLCFTLFVLSVWCSFLVARHSIKRHVDLFFVSSFAHRIRFNSIQVLFCVHAANFPAWFTIYLFYCHVAVCLRVRVCCCLLDNALQKMFDTIKSQWIFCFISAFSTNEQPYERCT